MDTIDIIDCFSIIKDLETSDNESYGIYMKMLRTLLKKRAVRANNDASVLLKNKTKCSTVLAQNGFSSEQIDKFHEFVLHMEHYMEQLVQEDDDEEDDEETDDEDYEEDDDETDEDEDDCDDEDEDNEADEELTRVQKLYLHFLQEANETDAKAAWIAGYITGSMFGGGAAGPSSCAPGCKCI